MPRTDLPILIIDDEELVRRAAALLLQRAGFKVHEASTAEQGLERVQADRYGCVLTDLRMPGIGGHAFVRHSRKIDPDLPIVVMSGHGDMHEVIECMRAGVCDYVVKPWGEGELAAVVGRALDLRESRDSSLPAEPADAETVRPPAEPPPQPESAASESTQQPKTGPRRILTPYVGVAPSRRAMLALLVERIRAGEMMLPATSAVAAEVRRMASAGQCSPADLKQVIERDPELGARLVPLANSSLYRGFKASDLPAAIARVGVREMPYLVEALFAKDFYTLDSNLMQEELKQVWRHSMARGVAMRFLCAEVPRLGIPAERGFLAGLFSDSGVPYLARVLGQVAPATIRQELSSIVLEHHAVVGGTVVQGWKLPAECFDAARRHHDTLPLVSTPPILQLAWAAGTICADLEITGDPGPIPPGEEALGRLVPDPVRRQAVASMTNSYLRAHASVLDGD